MKMRDETEKLYKEQRKGKQREKLMKDKGAQRKGKYEVAGKFVEK